MAITKNAAQALEVVNLELKIAKESEQYARKIAIRYIKRWVKKNPNYGHTRDFCVKDGALWEGHWQVCFDTLTMDFLKRILKEINHLENLK